MVVRACSRPRLLVAVLAMAAGACSVDTRTATATSDDGIASITQTATERQSIGSVWIHAFGRWTSALHTSATNEPLATSPAYVAYWYFFDQIASGVSPHVQTGGNWRVASAIALRHGVCPPEAFAPANAQPDDATRFDVALAALETSLASGPLHDPTKRHDRRVVRAELDRAFQLRPETTAMLDAVFGEDASKSFLSMTSPADPSGTPLLRASDVRVAYPGATGTKATTTLANALQDFRPVFYGATSGEDSRDFLARVQHAMNDGAPVLLTWFVDFSALEVRDVPLKGSFNLATLRELGPGMQGGHTALLSAYAARLPDGAVVPEEPTLGVRAPTSDALSSAEVVSLRFPSDWGSAHPAKATVPGMPPYHDLHLDYLTAPIARCEVRNGATDTTSCSSTQVPLESVVLPPGY